MAGLSDALETTMDATVIALGHARSRLFFETDFRPRNMRARLMMQTAKLAKPQLDQRYAKRINEFLKDLSA